MGKTEGETVTVSVGVIETVGESVVEPVGEGQEVAVTV